VTLRYVMTTMLAACALSLSAQAREARNDVTVEIVDRNGAAFQQFPTRTRSGNDAYRAYLQAEPGARYRIRVRNGSGERIAVVIAVDGRNIISGARSELARGEPMYVLAPWENEEYSGWRTSLADVHEFYFTDWQDSYAEAFGDRSAKGVIAVAVYREKERKRDIRQPQHSNEKRDAASAPSSARGEASEPGTGFGDERHEPATRVAFDAEKRASSRVFLKYEWRDTLCRKRIVDCASERNRFWDEDLAFAPYPPGWPGHR
jgi:hypothetical protein